MNLSHLAVPFVAEGIGVFLLVFSQAWIGRVENHSGPNGLGAFKHFNTASAPTNITLAPGVEELEFPHQIVWATSAFAFMVIGLIYALEPVSGAHLNPAFTLCDVLAGKTQWKRSLGYVAAHVIGAILAGRLLAALEVAAADDVQWFHALPELLYTSLLCFVTLNATCEEATRGNEFYGISIGMVYIAGGVAVGSTSAFNPALTIGSYASIPSFDIRKIITCLAILAAQCIGGAFAAQLFKVCRPHEYDSRVDQGEMTTKAAGEFIGTFYIALTLCLNTMTRSVAASWSMAAALMSATYSLATVASGANLNPSVTLGLLLSGRDKIDPKDGRLYIITQVFAGVCAGVIAGIYARASNKLEPLEAGPGNPVLSEASNFATDFMFTSILVFTWLAMLTTGSDTQSFFGLAIASCVTASAVSALNPAVMLGQVVAVIVQGSSFGWGFLQALLFVAAELAGGCAGSGAFRLLYRREFDGHYLERMLHMSENPMGMQVGSQVAGNEREMAWKESVADFKNRACTVCNY